MPRYGNKRTISNSNEFYEFLRKKRGNPKAIVQYNTITMRNPTISERASLKTINHAWKYGDRYYRLADQFYGDVRYWWVIAWWNARPTEADVKPGDVITIPISIKDALKVLDSY